MSKKQPKQPKQPKQSEPIDDIYSPFFGQVKEWDYFFTKSEDKDLTYPRRLGMECFLQHNKVFVNAFTGRPCHSDSYMTLVEFKALDAAYDLMNATVGSVPADWIPYAKTWAFGINMQPPFRLVGMTLLRKAGLKPDEVEATMKIPEKT